MGAVEEHHRASSPSVRVAVITVSDTRTLEDDESGKAVRELLRAAGHSVPAHAIVRDEPLPVRDEVRRLLVNGIAQVVVTTGGTGISARDSTYEALSMLIEKRLDGFGELFRALSYESIGPAAMMSRAVAGTCLGGMVVALPGSLDAVRLACEKLLVPELGHMAKLAARASRADARIELASGEIGPRVAATLRLAERFASDVASIAAGAPGSRRRAPSSIATRRCAPTSRSSCATTRCARSPPHLSGPPPRYAELAILAGQLAAAIPSPRSEPPAGASEGGGA